MASPKVKAVLEDNGQSTAKNELAFFFRLICKNLKINPNKWEYFLQEFLDQNPNLVNANPKDRSYARGNLNTQLANDKLTWRTFMDGLRFLKATGATLTIDLDFPDKKTRHSMRINLATPDADSTVFDPLDAEVESGLASHLSPPIPPSLTDSIEAADPKPTESLSISEQIKRSLQKLVKKRRERARPDLSDEDDTSESVEE